jgi:hypothetical protein
MYGESSAAQAHIAVIGRRVGADERQRVFPSGFTALSEAHGDEQAADLVGGFCAAVRLLRL